MVGGLVAKRQRVVACFKYSGLEVESGLGILDDNRWWHGVHKEPVVRLGERQSGHLSAINNTALA